jgi:radical SAM-linked protein
MPKALRFKFSRGPELKYIAHLDMLRLFERAIKRAGLPVAYTQGFNPRQKLVFGLPIAVGLTSSSEYADIEFDRDISADEFIKSLNAHLPEGVRIIEAAAFSGKDNIMNQVASAKYELSFTTSDALSHFALDNMVRDFLAKDEIMVMKKTKKGPRPLNIRPLIYSLTIRKAGDNGCMLDAFLSAGAENNLRPDLLMEAFQKETGMAIHVDAMHRKALFASLMNEWKNPLEVANG